MVIEPQFDFAGDFSGEYAAVLVDRVVIYIDTNGDRFNV